MGVDENKKIAKEFTERMGRGESSALNDLATENFIGHMLVGTRLDFDRELYRQTNDRGHRGFPDYTMTVDDMIAEDDKVLVLSTRRGTNTAVFIEGIPPTGNYVEICRFALYRFEQGKIAEMWLMDDMFGQFQQLGYIGSRDEILKAYMEKR